MFQQDLHIEEGLGGVQGQVGDPQGEGVSPDRVLEEKLQATAFCGAGDRHIHVVQVELGTPGLQAGLTGLIHVRRAWGRQADRHLRIQHGRSENEQPPSAARKKNEEENFEFLGKLASSAGWTLSTTKLKGVTIQKDGCLSRITSTR